MKKFIKDRIKITLQGKTEFSYLIDLYDTAITKKWLKLLREILLNKLTLEKNYCFLGYARNDRNLEFLVDQVNTNCRTVNLFNNKGVWQKGNLDPYSVRDDFTKDDFMYSESLPIGTYVPAWQDERLHQDTKHNLGCMLKHETCNILHRYFEDLQGQAWNISEYYRLADRETRYAIRQLNNLCHEIESFVNAYRKSKYEPNWIRPSQITTFLKATRKELTDNDLKSFQENGYARELGGVYLHWSQIGKTLYEVWRDEDHEVGEEGITHQRYFSGEFDIEWGQTITERHKWKAEELKNFRQWLVDNRYDPDDPKLALGYCKIGQVNLFESFKTGKFLNIYHKMLPSLNIKRIEIVSDNSANSTYCDYPYSLGDSEWKQIQMDSLYGGLE